eukprot:EG_transcript_25190
MKSSLWLNCLSAKVQSNLLEPNNHSYYCPQPKPLGKPDCPPPVAVFGCLPRHCTPNPFPAPVYPLPGPPPPIAPEAEAPAASRWRHPGPVHSGGTYPRGALRRLSASRFGSHPSVATSRIAIRPPLPMPFGTASPQVTIEPLPGVFWLSAASHPLYASWHTTQTHPAPSTNNTHTFAVLYSSAVASPALLVC